MRIIFFAGIFQLFLQGQNSGSDVLEETVLEFFDQKFIRSREKTLSIPRQKDVYKKNILKKEIKKKLSFFTYTVKTKSLNFQIQ